MKNQFITDIPAAEMFKAIEQKRKPIQ